MEKNLPIAGETKIAARSTGFIITRDEGDGESGAPGHVEGVVVPIGVRQQISSYWDSFDEMMGGDIVVTKNHGKLFYEHENQIGGQTVIRTEYNGQECLFGKGDLALGNRNADDAYALLKQGSLDGISIGFVPKRYEVIEAEDRTDVDDAQRDLIIYHEIEIYEFSLVAFPAYEDKTPVTKVRSKDFGNDNEVQPRKDADMPQGDKELIDVVRSLADGVNSRREEAKKERNINEEKASFARSLMKSGLDETRMTAVIDKVEHSSNPDVDSIISDEKRRQDEINEAIKAERTKWEAEAEDKAKRTEDVTSQNATTPEEEAERSKEDGEINWRSYLPDYNEERKGE